MTITNEIDRRTRVFADAREQLRVACDALKCAQDALAREHLPGIRRAVKRAAEAEGVLRELVAEHPDLFVRPRSIILHGIKVGYQKGRGGIAFDDAERVVALIRKHLPEQADTLIKTSEAPVKPALAQLTVAELKRIGCQVIETADEVLIKAVDGEVDKLVDALLRGATEEVA